MPFGDKIIQLQSLQTHGNPISDTWSGLPSLYLLSGARCHVLTWVCALLGASVCSANSSGPAITLISERREWRRYCDAGQQDPLCSLELTSHHPLGYTHMVCGPAQSIPPSPSPLTRTHAHREACLCWGQYKSQIDLNPHPHILFKLDFGLILFRPLLSPP